MRTYEKRTHEEREGDRQRVLLALENANDWMTIGTIRDRVSGLTKYQARGTIKSLHSAGTIERQGRGGTGNPYRYALTGKFVPSQLIAEREKAPDIITRVRTTTPKDEAPNGSYKWLPAEVQQLIDEIRAKNMVRGDDLTDIADAHGRTVSAIDNRLYLLAKEGRIEWGTRTGTPRETAKAASPLTYKGPRPPITTVPLSKQVEALEQKERDWQKTMDELIATVRDYCEGNLTGKQLREAVTE